MVCTASLTQPSPSPPHHHRCPASLYRGSYIPFTWSRMPFRRLIPIGLTLLAGCGSLDSAEPPSPLAAYDIEGDWLLDLQLTSASFSCTHHNILLTLVATDSFHLRGTYGYGKGVCNGHGLGPADTVFINPLLTDTTFVRGSRLVIVRNSGLDTIAGFFHPTVQTLTGTAVSRGTLVADGFVYTIRGDWVAHRDTTP